MAALAKVRADTTQKMTLAEIETALYRDGAGGGSSHGTEDEADNAGGANNGLHPLLLPALRECVKAAAGAATATLHDVKSKE